jgi:uncharacterized repeat protein (TIGR01451 family)
MLFSCFLTKHGKKFQRVGIPRESMAMTIRDLFFGKTANQRKKNFARVLRVESLEDRKLLASVTLTPAKDNTLYQTSAGSVSSGAGNSIAFGLDHNDNLAMRGLINFDIASQVPAGATINSVTLTVWNNLTFSNSTPTVELHRATSDWGEGASAPTRFMPPYGAAKTNDATWLNTFYPSRTWNTPGGDFSPTISGSVTIGTDNKSYTWNSTSGMVSDVQSWLNSPSTNFGWLIKGDETRESGKMIDSKESTTASHRPSLTVQYTPAASSPDLTVSKTHTGNFRQGDVAEVYTITVNNVGAGASTGLVTVTDVLPAGLTAQAASGTGWTTNIVGSTVTATRSDSLANAASFPPLLITVGVSNSASSSLSNTATVSGGGETNTANDSATDVTTVLAVADLTLAKSHVGNFRQGVSASNYTLVVSNAGSGPTSGTVTVVDDIPAGLNAVSAAGTGWTTTISGSTVTATRTDSLAGGNSYPALIITVGVATNAAATVTNLAHVSGGGELNTANDSASDVTIVDGVADLAINKSHASSFQQGDLADSYFLTVSNVGPGATLGQVTVADTLPQGLIAKSASGTGWTTSISGSTITATRSDALNSSSSYPTLTVTVGVANDAPSSITNTAVVSGGGELNTANDSSSDVTLILSVADLTITKSHTDAFRQGDTQHNFLLTVRNIGASATQGVVTVVDTIPVGLTALSASGTGWTTTINGSTVTATRNDSLAAGSTYPSITIGCSVSTTAAPSIVNTANVSGGGELNIANDSASDSIVVAQVADLTITKTHSGTFEQGSTGGRYQINVRNSGVGPTVGQVAMSDSLPTGLTPISAVGSGWTTSIIGSRVTATRSDVLAPGASYPELVITVSIASDATANLTNVAQITGGGEINGDNDLASDPTLVTAPASDLVITKSHSGTFRQGDTSDAYTLTVLNSGSLASHGTVTVVDTLPTGLLATTAAGTGWQTSIVGSTVTATRSDVLASSASYPVLTLTVRVANDAPASITNSATVSGGGELNTTNDLASDITAIAQAGDLTVSSSHSANFRQGDTASVYSVVVNNTGAGPTVGLVTVTDTIPAGMTPTLASGTGWTTSIQGSTVTATRSDALAAGASYPPIAVTVSVSSTASASLSNTVQVVGGGELNTSNNSASDPTTIARVADLSITKTHSGNFRQGDAADSYSIVVSNASDAGATQGTVSVTDTIPTGMTATSVAGTGWTTNITGSIVTATRSDTLANGASYPAILITVRIAGNAPNSVTNTAQVAGGGELNVANDSASDTTSIIATADLTAIKSHSGSFKQGDSADTYTMVVSNTGSASSSGTVTLTDTLPTGLAAISGVGTGWTVSIAGQIVTATRSDALAGGASYPTLTLTVGVANDAPASIVNTVNVSGGGEVNSTNNSATDTVAVAQVADLTITKTHSNVFRQSDTSDSYTIVVSNTGLGATSGLVTVTDSLPAGLTATTAAGSGWITNIVGNVLTATRSDSLAAGASYPALSISVSVSSTAQASVVNTAQVAGGGELITANDTASDTTNIESASGSLSGFVYLDSSNSGKRTASNGQIMHGVAGITVTLQIQDTRGNWGIANGTSPAVTGADGSYHFERLVVGTYRIVMKLPKMFLDGKTTAGQINGATKGTAGTDQITIQLGSGENGTEYDFSVGGMQPTVASRRWSLASTAAIDQVFQELMAIDANK